MMKKKRKNKKKKKKIEVDWEIVREIFKRFKEKIIEKYIRFLKSAKNDVFARQGEKYVKAITEGKLEEFLRWNTDRVLGFKQGVEECYYAFVKLMDIYERTLNETIKETPNETIEKLKEREKQLKKQLKNKWKK
jgi:hypothetical protein